MLNLNNEYKKGFETMNKKYPKIFGEVFKKVSN